MHHPIATATVQAGSPSYVTVSVGAPIEDKDDETWLCPYTISRESGVVESGTVTGADSMNALVSALTMLAVKVDQLRVNGPVSWWGRRDDYFCLDELLPHRRGSVQVP
jgi:hypothetical protein